VTCPAKAYAPAVEISAWRGRLVPVFPALIVFDRLNDNLYKFAVFGRLFCAMREQLLRLAPGSSVKRQPEKLLSDSAEPYIELSAPPDRFMPSDHSASSSDYLAAERTFLAWIRTGLALMGFGFVVARFGLFLRELARTTLTNMPRIESSGVSLAVGTSLLLIGSAVTVGATINHVRLVARLSRGETIARPSGTAIAIALSLSALGVALAAYLVYVS